MGRLDRVWAVQGSSHRLVATRHRYSKDDQRLCLTDQGITGDTLPYLNPSSMSDIGITSIGHRLAILKAIYQLKMDMSRAASGSGYGGTRPDGMSGDEALDENHLEGDGEDGHFNGWEWTEDDWRPAGTTFLHLVWSDQRCQHSSILQTKTRCRGYKVLQTASSSHIPYPQHHPPLDNPWPFREWRTLRTAEAWAQWLRVLMMVAILPGWAWTMYH